MSIGPDVLGDDAVLVVSLGAEALAALVLAGRHVLAKIAQNIPSVTEQGHFGLHLILCLSVSVSFPRRSWTFYLATCSFLVLKLRTISI